jgi:hypothetical protein
MPTGQPLALYFLRVAAWEPGKTGPKNQIFISTMETVIVAN